MKANIKAQTKANTRANLGAAASKAKGPSTKGQAKMATQAKTALQTRKRGM